jgi:hypothetical protein
MGLVSFYVLRVAADVGNFGLKNQIDRQTFKSILHFQVPRRHVVSDGHRIAVPAKIVSRFAHSRTGAV